MKRVPLFEASDEKLKQLCAEKIKNLEKDYPYSAMADFSTDKDFFRDIADSIIDENHEYAHDKHEIMTMVSSAAGDYFAIYVDSLLERERKERTEYISIDEL